MSTAPTTQAEQEDAVHRHTWIGDDCPEGWRRVGSIDVADPADIVTARDKGRRIGEIYDGCSGSVAEPCCADTYARTPLGEEADNLRDRLESAEKAHLHLCEELGIAATALSYLNAKDLMARRDETIATLRAERDQLAADLRKAREERDAAVQLDAPERTLDPQWGMDAFRAVLGDKYTPKVWGKHRALHHSSLKHVMGLDGLPDEVRDVVASLIWDCGITGNRARFAFDELFAIRSQLVAAEDEATALRSDLRKAREETEKLRGVLKTIAEGEVMIFDEGLGFDVSFWMDEEEMSALARAALTPDPKDAGGTAKGEDHGA